MKRIKYVGILFILLVTGIVAGDGIGAFDINVPVKGKEVVSYPLDRSYYLIGETIPMGFSTNEPITLTLKPKSKETSQSIQVYQGPAHPILLNTHQLEPGTYEVLVNSQATDKTLTLVSPWRESATAIVNEQVWPVRPEHFPQLRHSGVNAVFVMGNARSYSKRNPLTDDLLGVGTSLFLNPSTRPTSFEPPRVWDWEMNNYAMRLSLIAQAHLRYPAFGGFCFEWDPSTVIRRPSIFFRYGDKQAEWIEYQKRSNEAVMQQFREATGLNPPTTKDLLRYVLAIGHPEYGPAIDLPTMRWLETIAKHMKPLPQNELADLEKRIVAWHEHLMDVYGKGHKFYQSQLDPIDPSLAHTTCINLDHGPISTGQYAPAGYQHLDFRHMSAWNDQIGIGEYDFQWLLSAALMNARNPKNQPIWVAQATGVAHGMPGKCLRAAAHNLANNGTGIGSAAEGGYSWLSSYGKGGKHKAAIDSAREFLHRFSCLATHAQGDHRVAILYSKTDFAHRITQESLGSLAWQAVVTLTRHGYTPKFITETEIEQGHLKDFQVLTIWNQTFDLPEEVRKKIEQFVENGGRVVGDGSTTITLPGMEKMKHSIYKIEARGVYGWSGPSQKMKPRGMAQISEFLHRQLAPGVLEILGDNGRAWYHQEEGVTSDVTLCQINPGPDVRYIVAVNDSWYAGHWSHAHWHQVKEKLVPSHFIPQGAVLYDLNEEHLIGAANQVVECDLTNVTARVFGIVKCPIKTIDLKATQEIMAGEPIGIRATFNGAEGKPIRAVLPLNLTILRPNKSIAFQGYRSTEPDGTFLFSYPLGVNAISGQWKVKLRSRLTGEEVTLPINVRPGNNTVQAQPIKTNVVARQTPALQKLLQQDTELVIPIFPSEQAEHHLQAAKKVQQALKKAGVKVRIWEKPEMSRYVLTYVPTKEQVAENERIDQGLAIGKIDRLTHFRREDYYTDIGGYRCGVHFLLFDLVGISGDSPLVEQLDTKGILWPQVTEAFPGKGKAVVQLIHNAFDPKRDTILIQATDAEGLIAGAKALTDLPDDRIGTSVSQARWALLKQWNIRGGPEKLSEKDLGDLTATNRAVKQNPQPFRLDLTGIEIPTKNEEPPAPTDFKRTYLNVPISTDDVAKKSVAQQRIREGFTDAYAGHNRTGNSDLRFSDATVIPVSLTEPKDCQIVVQGNFRYSDRQPRSQGSWKAILDLYKEIVPPVRRPMEWVVQVDSKTVGKLKACETDTKDVPIETLPFYMKKKPKSVSEEVVTKLCGKVRLPKGNHEIRLIHQNVVDGRLTGFAIHPTEE